MDKSRKGRGRRWGRRLATGLFSVAAIAAIWGLWLALRITSEFDARGWDLPAQVYAAPLELYAGRPLSADALLVELQRLGYARDASLGGPGRYRRGDDFIEIRVRPFRLAEGAVAEQHVRVDFSGGRIAALEDRSNGPSGSPLALMQLEPLLIGSIFPAHGEDRLIVTPEEVPPLLLAALISVEDRRFMQHMGIDLRAVARAAAVNLAAGEIRQGASTLTQQLVRSYFLTTERTWSRKIQEALMALALELRYDKAELLQAYVNEIYLGQDGARAIHGFGLASRFYFGKPLAELELQEIATLIAIVRGPSYYDPRRNPERAIERRNLVLDLMLEQGVIEAATHADAASAGLGVIGADRRRGTYYAAFLDLVRRQLANEYAREDLTAAGLSVYTTLDPIAQATVETSVGREIEALQTGRAPLEAAVIVTNPHNAEVLAVAGSRRTGFDGFNRALDARRQIGSLIKPAVYLAALESRKHTLATLIDDAPLDVLLDNGDTWSPENFDGEAHGPVTAIRALAESLNMATVRLGTRHRTRAYRRSAAATRHRARRAALSVAAAGRRRADPARGNPGIQLSGQWRLSCAAAQRSCRHQPRRCNAESLCAYDRSRRGPRCGLRRQSGTGARDGTRDRSPCSIIAADGPADRRKDGNVGWSEGQLVRRFLRRSTRRYLDRQRRQRTDRPDRQHGRGCSLVVNRPRPRYDLVRRPAAAALRGDLDRLRHRLADRRGLPAGGAAVLAAAGNPAESICLRQ